MNIDDILGRVKEIYGFKTKADLARWFDIPATTLYDRINNAQDPEKNKAKNFGNKLYEDILTRIAEDDRINPNYIFFGKPPKFFDEKTVRMIRGEELAAHDSDDVFAVPYYSNIEACACNDRLCDHNNCEPEYLVMPKVFYKKSSKNLYAVKVDSDIMSPNIKANSVIFVDTVDDFLTQNAVFVVKYKGDVHIRRVQKVDGHILLKADNIRYNTIICEPSDIKIVGRVVYSISVDNLLQ